MAIIILVSLLIVMAIYCVTQYRKIKQFETSCGNIFEAKQLVEHLKEEVEHQEEMLSELKGAINYHKTEERLATQRARSAAELATKDLEIEVVRRREEFERKLERELSVLEQASPKAALQSELDAINQEIATARQTLLVQQAQALEHQKEEDFANFHSINLTLSDLKDIELIREFEPRLTRQEAFRKLIWTEFIQKPIQSLCKILDVEKVKGIYKITNIKNGRMYIGQAVDIAARWKEHCKAALGIGSSSFMTNKFYKAMHDEGIENFTFEVLEAGDIDLNKREFYWIDFYNATTFGYNSKAGG